MAVSLSKDKVFEYLSSLSESQVKTVRFKQLKTQFSSAFRDSASSRANKAALRQFFAEFVADHLNQSAKKPKTSDEITQTQRDTAKEISDVNGIPGDSPSQDNHSVSISVQYPHPHHHSVKPEIDHHSPSLSANKASKSSRDVRTHPASSKTSDKLTKRRVRRKKQTTITAIGSDRRIGFHLSATSISKHRKNTQSECISHNRDPLLVRGMTLLTLNDGESLMKAPVSASIHDHPIRNTINDHVLPSTLDYDHSVSTTETKKRQSNQTITQVSSKKRTFSKMESTQPSSTILSKDHCSHGINALHSSYANTTTLKRHKRANKAISRDHNASSIAVSGDAAANAASAMSRVQREKRHSQVTFAKDKPTVIPNTMIDETVPILKQSSTINQKLPDRISFDIPSLVVTDAYRSRLGRLEMEMHRYHQKKENTSKSDSTLRESTVINSTHQLGSSMDIDTEEISSSLDRQIRQIKPIEISSESSGKCRCEWCFIVHNQLMRNNQEHKHQQQCHHQSPINVTFQFDNQCELNQHLALHNHPKAPFICPLRSSNESPLCSFQSSVTQGIIDHIQQCHKTIMTTTNHHQTQHHSHHRPPSQPESTLCSSSNMTSTIKPAMTKKRLIPAPLKLSKKRRRTTASFLKSSLNQPSSMLHNSPMMMDDTLSIKPEYHHHYHPHPSSIHRHSSMIPETIVCLRRNLRENVRLLLERNGLRSIHQFRFFDDAVPLIKYIEQEYYKYRNLKRQKSLPITIPDFLLKKPRIRVLIPQETMLSRPQNMPVTKFILDRVYSCNSGTWIHLWIGGGSSSSSMSHFEKTEYIRRIEESTGVCFDNSELPMPESIFTMIRNERRLVNSFSSAAGSVSSSQSGGSSVCSDDCKQTEHHSSPYLGSVFREQREKHAHRYRPAERPSSHAFHSGRDYHRIEMRHRKESSSFDRRNNRERCFKDRNNRDPRRRLGRREGMTADISEKARPYRRAHSRSVSPRKIEDINHKSLAQCPSISDSKRMTTENNGDSVMNGQSEVIKREPSEDADYDPLRLPLSQSGFESSTQRDCGKSDDNDCDHNNNDTTEVSGETGSSLSDEKHSGVLDNDGDLPLLRDNKDDHRYPHLADIDLSCSFLFTGDTHSTAVLSRDVTEQTHQNTAPKMTMDGLFKDVDLGFMDQSSRRKKRPMTMFGDNSNSDDEGSDEESNSESQSSSDDEFIFTGEKIRTPQKEVRNSERAITDDGLCSPGECSSHSRNSARSSRSNRSSLPDLVHPPNPKDFGYILKQTRMAE